MLSELEFEQVSSEVELEKVPSEGELEQVSSEVQLEKVPLEGELKVFSQLKVAHISESAV